VRLRYIRTVMRVIFTYNERSEVFLIFSELWQHALQTRNCRKVVVRG